MNQREKVTIQGHRAGKSMNFALMFLEHIEEGKAGIVFGQGYVVLPRKKYDDLVAAKRNNPEIEKGDG